MVHQRTCHVALSPLCAFMVLAAVCASAASAFAANIPLPEHPRPDWERPQWVNLNGQWDFGFEKGAYDRKITVPFGWGCEFSGVKNEKGKDTGYYRRTVKVPPEWKGKRVFLVVGASDYKTEFSFDGKNLGKHVGGYMPFEFELTDLVKWGEEQTAEFKIWDPDFLTALVGHYLIGKQGYGNVRGIWQTVYLEARGKDYLDSARFTPSIAKSSVKAELRLAAPASDSLVAEVKLDGKATKVSFAKGEIAKAVDIAVASPKLWDLDNPNLYDVTLTLGDDAVKTYFGFREVGTGKNANGDPYVTLNGKPIYLQLCLDQTFHPQGYYTFPTDEFMKNDILLSKRLALTGNRVHVKAEVPRKLYWADKLGLLIQADVPNAWGAVCDKMFAEHWDCFEGMVKRDFNHPSIYQWTLFNETWGLCSAGYGKRGAKYRPEAQRRVADAYRKPKASAWSEGTAEVLGGLKLNGFGKGWFEYEVAVPPQGGTFRAELSAKRRNWKDRKERGRQIDYVVGKRSAERTKNPSAYPQTSDEKFPANLTVRVGCTVALKYVLPDDPADHRGILSWLAQPRKGYLRDAGSYGYLVEVKIPPEAVKDGKATIRLESDAGLAVYGPRFGRYPLGPIAAP